MRKIILVVLMFINLNANVSFEKALERVFIEKPERLEFLKAHSEKIFEKRAGTYIFSTAKKKKDDFQKNIDNMLTYSERKQVQSIMSGRVVVIKKSEEFAQKKNEVELEDNGELQFMIIIGTLFFALLSWFARTIGIGIAVAYARKIFNW